MSPDNHDDLSHLLSLQDSVLETPPSSPSSTRPASLGYSSDDDLPRRSGNVDLSAFKAAVEDFMDYDVETAKKAIKASKPNNSTDPDVEKFSGLRIRNQLLSPAELSNQFSDIRFVRLTSIKNLIKGDTLSGCWATVGVLTEKGTPKTSSTGKGYCIWKIGCLDEQSISIFLFGDAYKKHCKEPASTVFAFFNAGVRKDASGPGFQLSVYNSNQILKIGTSIDYGVCKGKRKDGLPCSMVINKRRGIYCNYHRVKTSEKYTVTRTELKGGNLRTAFRNPRQSEGIYMVDPLEDKTNIMKPKTTKLLSVEGLKKALSNAGKVTTNPYSQGIRFLNEITVSVGPRTTKNESTQQSNANNSSKRPMPKAKSDSSGAMQSQLRDSKRKRTEPSQVSARKISKTTDNVIELEYISSDEDSIKADFIFGK